MARSSKSLAVIVILLFFAIGIFMLSGPGGQGGGAPGPAGVPEASDLFQADGFVNDFAEVIPPEDEAAMRAIIEAVQRQTGAEIAVVTVESMAPYPTIEDFGIALAEEWGVGPEESDAGAILIVAVEERRARIEVGYGLEGAIPDGRAGAILDDYVIPFLAQNDYGEGLRNGVAALAQVVANEYGIEISDLEVRQPASQGQSQRQDEGSGLGNLFYFLFILVFFGGRWFFWPLLFAGRRRMFYGGGFGSSGGFGGSGSFGGFGGGGFGGGGASRGF